MKQMSELKRYHAMTQEAMGGRKRRIISLRDKVQSRFQEN